MSLHKKIHLVLICVVAGYVLLSYAIQSAIVIPAFGHLDRENASRDVRRVGHTVREELAGLRSQGVDWAHWDDAYAFLNGNYPAFISTNFSASTLSTMDLDFMLFYDRNGKLVQSQVADADGSHQLQTFFAQVHVSDLLARHASLESEVSGVVDTPSGWMLICSLPILTTDAKGPFAGALVLGRSMRSAWIERKRLQTQVDFSLLGADDPVWAAKPDVATQVFHLGEATFSSVQDTELLSYWLLRDIFDQPALVVEARTPRETMALGTKTVDLTTLFLVLAGVLVIGVMWLLLERTIVAPLFKLKAHILGIRQTGELSKRMGLKRFDEIGHLANEFDALTSQLQEARTKLLQQSYKAGMAETAAGVLHNIRNAMTPLVNRIAKASASIEEARTLRLDAALAQMQQQPGGNGRCAKLAQYVDLAIGELERLHGTALDDMRVASEQASQVEAILKEQERLTHSEPVIETLDLADVVQEAANVVPVNQASGTLLKVHESIRGPRIRAHRLGLVQVLCNVLVNAREAIERGKQQRGCISLMAERESQQDGDSIIRLRIKDNGVGIEPERLTLIFQRGHTSKPEGNGGLGLHWCANTLTGMGGWLSVYSAGPGEGAEFQVHIPEG